MTAQERKKYEAYIRRYYDIYFRMDALYNLWSSANRIQDTTLFVLNEISAQECCTQRSLASRLGYSKQTISSALRRLEQGGIISRQRDPMDQRNNLALTPRASSPACGTPRSGPFNPGPTRRPSRFSRPSTSSPALWRTAS